MRIGRTQPSKTRRWCWCGKRLSNLKHCTKGGLDDLEAEAKTNYPGWMANSPAEGSECNCVCMSQCAGENRLWFSFLISVKAIRKGDEILSNALPYDKEWETF